MVLIIGGAYQGKLDYAMKNYGITSDDVFDCEQKNSIDFSKSTIYSIDKLILQQIKDGIDPVLYVKESLHQFKSKIIICEDISCGVVPIDGLMRKWREYVGYTLATVSRECDEVVRVFCGLGTKLK